MGTGARRCRLPATFCAALVSLDEEDMTSLRAFGGLQSFPSRTRDPVPADYSTGSVGIGSTAPIWPESGD